MIAFLAGFGITLAVLFVIFAGIISFSVLISVIRVAINHELGTASKVFWILLCLCLPPSAFFYFAFIDKNPLLKLTGWFCIIILVITALTGGTALWGGVEQIRHNPDILFEAFPPVENPASVPEKPETPDDSSVAL